MTGDTSHDGNHSPAAAVSQRMKRTLTIASALTVLFAATACGSSDPADGSPTAPPPVATTEPETPSTPSTPTTNTPTTPSFEPPDSSAPPDTDPPATPAPTTPAPPTTPTTPTEPTRPGETEDVTVDDGTFDSIGEMGAAASVVVVGEVVEVTSLGRPFLDRDPDANEFVAITIETTDTLRGDPIAEIVLPWEAFGTDGDGERTSTLITNGIRPADVGDRLVLFLRPADPQFAEFVGGDPTHQLVKLDGIAYLDGDVVVATELGSTAAEQLAGLTLDDIRATLTL